MSDMSAETVVVIWDDAARAVGYDVIVTDVNTRSAKTYKWADLMTRISLSNTNIFPCLVNRKAMFHSLSLINSS